MESIREIFKIGMVRQRPDWCLSRQRFWGVPVPMITCKDCGEAQHDENLFQSIEKRAFAEGTDFWFADPVEKIIPQGYKCKCGSTNFRKETDVLDVWLDSGVSWMAVLKRQEQATGHKLFPADLYLEGSDQHRGWFQSSLISSVALTGKAPYKTVLTHGFLLDENGKAMTMLAARRIKAPLDTEMINQPQQKTVLLLPESDSMDVVLVSGDREPVVADTAEALGLTRYYAGVFPEEKAAIVESIQKEGKKVAFVGDGFNDAPALSRADIGISLSTGTDIAIESSDLTLMRQDLQAVLEAINLSRAIRRTIKENLAWAFIYNIILIPLAAGVLYPVNGTTLPPAMGKYGQHLFAFLGLQAGFSEFNVPVAVLVPQEVVKRVGRAGKVVVLHAVACLAHGYSIAAQYPAVA